MNCKTCFKETEIGLIPEEWNVKKLSDLAIITDSLHKTPNYVENGYPMVRVKDLKEGFLNINGALLVDSNVYNEFTRRCKPKKGDILVSRVGSYGIFSYINSNEIFCLGQNTALISSNINSLYLFYCLKSSIVKTQIEKTVVGSTQKTLSLKNINNILIPVCGPEKQSIIANFLYSLDSKIELNRQMNTILEQMAQAIFKHWFIDFEFPDENGQPYRSSGGEMVDSELGEIPAGWEVKILSDLCEYIMSGGTPRTKVPEYWDGDIPWLSSGETRNRFIINTEKSISKIGVENSSTRLARSGSTVIASAGQGHTRGQTSLLLLDTYVNQSVVSLAADTKLISDFYLFFNLARRYDEMRRISDSHSSRGSLTTKLLGNLKVTCPPIDLIRRFDQIAEPIVNQIHYNLEQADTLSQFRDSLLPKLMSGKIRVKQ